MSLMDKMKKIGSITASNSLDKSTFFNEKDMVPTEIPALNIALSGSINGGLTPGLTVLAGPSRTFKTNMGLKMVSAYLKAHPEAICLFYDSEFGATEEYISSMGVDPSRLLHIPLIDIEQLKIDVVQKLEAIERYDPVKKTGDQLIIFIDSIGNLASRKEVEDALNEKTVADMTRSKQIKSLFRMMTPYLTHKNIPCVAINHTYQTMEMFSKAVISGGTGVMYSANTAFIISRAQEKDKNNDLEGYTFTINIEKSRFVREKSKIPLTVRFDEGIDYYSGILDLALEGQFIVQPTKQSYQLAGSTDSVKKKNIEPLLDAVLADDTFKQFVIDKYKLSGTMSQQIVDDSDDN